MVRDAMESGICQRSVQEKTSPTLSLCWAHLPRHPAGAENPLKERASLIPVLWGAGGGFSAQPNNKPVNTS